MRFVIDTNQVSAVARTVEFDGTQYQDVTIVLPPLVWAETTLGANAQHRLCQLGKYRVLFGMDEDAVWTDVSRLTDKEIPHFVPIIPIHTSYHELLSQSLTQRIPILYDQARRIREYHRELEALATQKIRLARKSYRDAKSRGEQVILADDYETIQEAMGIYGRDAKSPIGQVVLASVGKATHGQACIRSDEALYAAVLANPYLSRFCRLVLCTKLGWAKAWKNNALNVDMSENQHDYPDMSLVLYARDGDTIVTADDQLTLRIRHIEPKERIAVASWNECLRRMSA